MKLWILEPINGNNGPWEPWYDKAFGFVVRAESESEARKIADENAGDENDWGKRHPWLDEKKSKCAELLPDGPPKMILRDFSAA